MVDEERKQNHFHEPSSHGVKCGLPGVEMTCLSFRLGGHLARGVEPPDELLAQLSDAVIGHLSGDVIGDYGEDDEPPYDPSEEDEGMLNPQGLHLLRTASAYVAASVFDLYRKIRRD